MKIYLTSWRLASVSPSQYASRMTPNDPQAKRTMEEVLAEARNKLKILELESARAIRGVSLIAEAPLKVERMKTAAYYLGLVYGDIATKQPQWRLQAFFNDHSSLIAHVMAGIGHQNYEQGTYWDGFFRQLHLDEKLELGRFAGKARADISAEWGDCFLNTLASNGLPTFAGFSQKYVVPIMVHAGIPISTLQNYFSALDRGLHKVGFNAEAIVNQLTNPYSPERNGTNKPVLRFLEFGGEFAIEFVDRSLDALAKLAREESLDSHPLPPEVLEAAGEFFHHPQQRSLSLNRNSNVLKAGNLSVILDPTGGGMLLELPEINTENPNFRWQIGIDDSQIDIDPKILAGGDFTARASIRFPVEKPVRQIQVKASDGFINREITLYSSEFPAIYFTLQGELIPTNVALPKGQIYILVAKGRSLAFDNKDLRIQEEIPPLGWHAWALYRVDLSESTSFKLFEDGNSRAVAQKTKATISTDSGIPGLSYRGLPIRTSRPIIRIPEGVDLEWQIEVQNLADSSTNTYTHKTADVIGLEIDPFPETIAPIFGEFHIFVRGPLGLGTSQRIVVVEGLELISPKDWRSIQENGLSEYIAEFTSSSFKIEPKYSYFSPTSTEEVVQISDENLTLKLNFQPPAISIAHRFNGIPQPWRFGPLTISLEELDASEIMIRIPSKYSRSQLSILKNEKIYRSISTSLKQNDQLLDFELSNFSGEMKQLKEAELFLDFGGLNLQVGRIRPQVITTAIEASQFDLFLQDFVGGQVVARIWSLFEPWRNFQDVFVPPSGNIQIPEELFGLGDLCVQLELHDPWAHSTLSNYPTNENLHFLKIPSVPEKISVSGSFFETGRFSPASKIDKFSKCWAAIRMFACLGEQMGVSLERITAATKLLRDEPIRALEVLALTNSTFEESIHAISLSGLFSASISSQPRTKLNDGEFADRILKAPGAMLLSATATLSTQLSPTNFPLTWGYIHTRFGSAFREITISGRVNDFQVGSFVDMERYLKFDPTRAVSLVEATGAYPREYLHSDSRLIAGLELFQIREEITANLPHQFLGKLMTDLLREFSTFLPYAHRYVFSRLPRPDIASDAENWMFLPALSLALAFLNRGNAHGELSTYSILSRTETLLTRFARHAPKILFSDIAMADLVILSQDSASRPIFASIEEPNQ